MSEPLTDECLDQMIRDATGLSGLPPRAAHVVSAVAELRRLRADVDAVKSDYWRVEGERGNAMTSPPLLLAAANGIDIASYTEHGTRCPKWWIANTGRVPEALKGKPCSCGLDEQLEAVRVMAEAWRELLGQPTTERVSPYFYASPGCEDMAPRVVLTIGTPARLGGHGAVDHMYETAWALRLAADLLRACAEVDARAATLEKP